MNSTKIIFLMNIIIFTLIMTAPPLVYAGKGDGHGDHGDHGDHGQEESHGSKKKSKDSHDGHGHGTKDDHNDDKKGHDDHDDHGEEDGHDEENLKLDNEAREMINLKTARVQKRKLGGRLKVYGKISKDTENYSSVSFDGEGRVDQIKVNLGRMVDKGDVLLTIRRIDDKVEKVYSSMHGIVLSIFVKPGERVDSLTSLVSIMDVDTLRATIDIYEKDLRFIKEGQKVVLQTSAYPEKNFHGKVVYISPQVNAQTQSIKVRVDVDNSEHFLKLGMFVSGELIYSFDQGSVLAVPTSAIQELNGESIVFVSGEGDGLELREVSLGRSINDYIEIKSGLSSGERVVTQGSFYLKSEKAKAGFGDGHNH